MDTEKPIIAIVGPTASGKSDLAMRLAQECSGEIVCADSRTVYRGMDIGTAKPSRADQAAINHHCLDLVNPDERFSAAEFKRWALVAIKDIHARQKIPFIVGGSGLYIDGLIYDFEFIINSNPKKRQRLEAMDLNQLHAEAEKAGIATSEIDFQNKRHLARAIERGGVFINKKPLPDNCLLVGIDIAKAKLDQRIEDRIDKMLIQGLEVETRQLLAKYGPNAPGLLAPGYKALIQYIDRKISLEQAKKQFISGDKKLAKRQRTWFKRNQDIIWIKNYPEAKKVVSDFLSKFDTIH